MHFNLKYVVPIIYFIPLVSGTKLHMKAFLSHPTHLTYQVVNAKQQCFNAAITLPVPAGSETQINPDQLWQKLQRESLEPNFRTAIKFKELVANRLQELRKAKKANYLLLGFSNKGE